MVISSRRVSVRYIVWLLRRIRSAATLAILLFGFLTSLSGGSLCAEEQRITGRFIAVSDLHFDPFAAPELVNELAAAPPERWREILGRTAADRYGSYGRDTTWPLLESALDQMHAVEPDPAFLILTGDLLAHRFRSKFEASATNHSEDDYRGFVDKTASFLAEEIRRRFPERRVFLTLGNEDSDCGDYRLSPGGIFLNDTLRLAAKLAGAGDDPSFARDWLSGHGYDLASGAIPGLRIIAVNSVFLSERYRDACGGSPAGLLRKDVISWLSERLEAVSRAGETAWLLFHIPPGADPYATVRRGACPSGLTAMWAAEQAQDFSDVLQRYANTVTATYAGHTHMDEFRVIGRDGRLDGFTLNTPGISPVFGQNPGFHVYSYGASGNLVDRETWYADGLDPAAATGRLTWKREYRFSELWQLPALDAANLARLADLIGTDEQARAKWFSVYPVGRTANWNLPDGVTSLSPETFRAYDCAMKHVDAGEYRRCLCGAEQRRQ